MTPGQQATDLDRTYRWWWARNHWRGRLINALRHRAEGGRPAPQAAGVGPLPGPSRGAAPSGEIS